MTKRNRVEYYATGVHASGEVRLVWGETFSLANDPVRLATYKTREECERAASLAVDKCAAHHEPVTDVLVFARPVPASARCSR